MLDPVRGPEVEDVPLLRRLVRSAFQQRRKMLRTALRREFPNLSEAAEEAGIDPRRRPQTLEPEEFVGLANLLAREGGP